MKKTIISLVGLFLVIHSASAGTIDDFLNNATINVTSPDAINVQGRGYWTGGSIRVRTPRTIINPVHITLPSIRAGCQGIDIVNGSMDFIDNFSDLLDFLGDSLTSSTGVLLAGIGAVCPQCKEIITSVETIANQLNQMQFDSCDLANKVADEGTQMFKKAVDTLVPDGTFSSFSDAQKKVLGSANDLLNRWSEALRKNGCDVNDDSCIYSIFKTKANGSLVYKSFLEKAVSRTYFKDDTNAVKILRAVIGDIFIEENTNKSNEKSPFSLRYVGPIYNKDIKSFVDILINGNPVDGNSCNASTTIEGIRNDGSAVTLNNLITPACVDVKNTLYNIIQKYRNRTPLSEREKKFLSQFRIPMYKILNTFSIEPVLIDNIKVDAVEVLSSELMYYKMLGLLNEINRELSLLRNLKEPGDTQINIKQIEEMQKNLSNVVNGFYKEYAESISEWNNKLNKETIYQDMSKRIIGRMAQNPVVGAYIFTRGLSR